MQDKTSYHKQYWSIKFYNWHTCQVHVWNIIIQSCLCLLQHTCHKSSGNWDNLLERRSNVCSLAKHSVRFWDTSDVIFCTKFSDMSKYSSVLNSSVLSEMKFDIAYSNLEKIVVLKFILDSKITQ
jgi:hypothetical protein